ncbi:MAG TPA: ACT domain-containing protein [Clostridia bacterium]|nr:ACT domain-containing protein [Clostridia bacterium]
MDGMPRYLLVDCEVLPEVFHKVVEAKRYLASGQVHSVNEAVRLAGISRSAFYKYKDKVHPFNNKDGGRIITLHTMLRDAPGVLSELIGRLYRSGANILTINQNIPIGGVAPVSVSARIDGLRIPLEEMLVLLREIDGVENIEIVSGQ